MDWKKKIKLVLKYIIVTVTEQYDETLATQGLFQTNLIFLPRSVEPFEKGM